MLMTIMLVAVAASRSSAAEVTDIRANSEQDKTRIVIEIDEPVQYQTHFSMLDAPTSSPSISISLFNTRLGSIRKATSINSDSLALGDPRDELVKTVAFKEIAGNIVDVGISLKQHANFNVFSLDSPDRVVIDIIPAEVEQAVGAYSNTPLLEVGPSNVGAGLTASIQGMRDLPLPQPQTVEQDTSSLPTSSQRGRPPPLSPFAPIPAYAGTPKLDSATRGKDYLGREGLVSIPPIQLCFNALFVVLLIVVGVIQARHVVSLRRLSQVAESGKRRYSNSLRGNAGEDSPACGGAIKGSNTVKKNESFVDMIASARHANLGSPKAAAPSARAVSPLSKGEQSPRSPFGKGDGRIADTSQELSKKRDKSVWARNAASAVSSAPASGGSPRTRGMRGQTDHKAMKKSKRRIRKAEACAETPHQKQYEKVYELAQLGMDRLAISQQSNVPIGEVNLILDLSKARAQSGEQRA